uniref:VWFA domain-containing protein n=1 Tax=uncultured Bacillota bacterium TaxID=344338 RepID=A0A650ENC8_9FIRM|nr:hypothetical protein Firmicute1046_0080 [uncultured Firmicutes bacterium]
MKITAKMLKRLIRDESERISDQELFTSEAMRNKFERMANGISKRYNRPLKVYLHWECENLTYTAKTNNFQIEINAGSWIVQRYSQRTDRYRALLGLLAHELGHVLYTDFKVANTYYTHLAYRDWYPKRPLFEDEDLQRRVWDIERTFLSLGTENFCKLVQKLDNYFEDVYIENRLCRNYPGSFADSIDLLGESIRTNARNAIQASAKEPKQLAKLVTQIFAYVRAGERDYSNLDKECAVVFEQCIPYLELGLTSPEPKERYDAVNRLGVLLWPYLDQIEDLEETSFPESEPPKGNTLSIAQTEQEKNGDAKAIPVETDAVEKVLQNIVDEIAAQAVYVALERELYKELDDNLAHMPYAGAHLGITRHIFRQIEITEHMLWKYDTETPKLLRLADAACRNLRQVSLEQQRGGTRTGLYMGRGIRGSDLYRKDKRFFYNRKLPRKGFDIAVMVLCDESGSMDGERIDKTRQSAFLLYSICRKLNIPVSVYGHSADIAYDLELYSYAEFDSVDNKDCYRIMGMQSRNNNRDGAAIRFAAEKLLARPEELKVLLIPNDGRPSAHGYGGKAALEDLQETIQKYTHKGLNIYGIAIGNDIENLKQIYGSNFLEVQDIENLPKILTGLLKRLAKRSLK